VVLVPAATALFQLAFTAVAAVPLVVTVAFHAWLIDWPLASVHLTVQPLVMPADPAVTVTSPWNPPDQLPTCLYVAVQAPVPPPPVVGEVVGLADVGRGLLGVADGVADRVGVALAVGVGVLPDPPKFTSLQK